MKAKRVISGALAGLLCATTVGVFSSCDGSSAEGVIKVAYAKAGYGSTFMDAWEAEFEAMYDGKYDVQLEGEPGMTEEFVNRLDTGTNLPDVFMIMETGWQKMAAKGRLEPLNDIYETVDEETGKKMEDFINPNVRDYGRLTNGNDYVIPLSDGAVGIVYNVDMFEENDWQVPTTLEELVALCDTINAAQIPVEELGGAEDGAFVQPFALNAGYGDYLGETWWAQYEGAENFTRFFEFEHPKVYLQQGRVEALTAFQTLFYNPNGGKNKKKNTWPSVSSHTDAHAFFGMGAAAMIIEGSWLENESKNTIGNSVNYKMMRTPYLTDALKDKYTAAGSTPILASQAGDFMCIPTEAANKEGAKLFLQYVNSKKGCETFTKATKGSQRPFQYKASEVQYEQGQEPSAFLQSCADIYENSEIVYHFSTNPMNWENGLGKWPKQTPYSSMIVEGTTPIGICQAIVDYAYKNWWDIYAQVA